MYAANGVMRCSTTSFLCHSNAPASHDHAWRQDEAKCTVSYGSRASGLLLITLNGCASIHHHAKPGNLFAPAGELLECGGRLTATWCPVVHASACWCGYSPRCVRGASMKGEWGVHWCRAVKPSATRVHSKGCIRVVALTAAQLSRRQAGQPSHTLHTAMPCDTVYYIYIKGVASQPQGVLSASWHGPRRAPGPPRRMRRTRARST